MAKFKVVLEQKVTERKELIIEANSRDDLTAEKVFGEPPAGKGYDDLIYEGMTVYSETPPATDDYEFVQIAYGDRYITEISDVETDEGAL